LSTELKKWIDSGINLNSSVIIPLLLSDGGEKPKKRLFFSGTSEVLHNIWADAFFY